MSCKVKRSSSLLSFRESQSFILPNFGEIPLNVNCPMRMGSYQ